MKNFSLKLIAWYEQHKRDLPWRHTKDAYAVWLSEVILQQTRVVQGTDYYHSFLKAFPTVSELAAAGQEHVLKLWQGLGYYSRARNMHETARIIDRDFDGKFPDTYEGLIKLKGIGPYTASAIASICFNRSAAVLDGNVMRVLSRLYGLRKPIDTSRGKKQLQELAASLIDKKQPGLFNQAIMEFGALHCTPANARCSTCPFMASCVAYEQGIVNELPVKEKRPKTKNLFFYYFDVRWNGKMYLKKRTDKGIWQGLHDFPMVETSQKIAVENAIDHFRKESDFNNDFEVTSVSNEFTHVLTHRKIYARFISLSIAKRWNRPPKDVFEINADDVDVYSVPRLIEKYLKLQK